MNQSKLKPCLWFCTDEGNISGLLNYYHEIFGKDFSFEEIISLGETPSGNTELCEVNFFGQAYTLMCTAKEHQPLNDAFSLIIHCEHQEEIDKFWNYFTIEGEESYCGWCIDKYGLRWQVVPGNLPELMSRPGANDVMMKQRKIIISEY